MRRALLWIITAAIAAGAGVAGVVAADRLLFPAGKAGSIGDPRAMGYYDSRRPNLTVSTFSLYPWTGGHTQADALTRLTGADPEGAIRTGDHGFFVDFDLDAPPPRETGELRLLWTGGSGAAGWGARRNESMIYRRLESLYAARRDCGPETTLRVVNLAMGGSVSYQNFIALNRWGHALAPDAVVSFAGHNDMDPLHTGIEAWRGYATVAGLVRATRFGENPEWFMRLAQWLHGFAHHSGIGNVVRAADLARLERAARDEYETAIGARDLNADARFAVARDAYVHALASIRRDFAGLPMFAILQPYMATDADPDRSAPKSPFSRGEWVAFYERLFDGARSRLADSGIVFFDAHRHYRERMAERYRPDDGVHMNDEKQREIAQALADLVFPALCTGASTR